MKPIIVDGREYVGLTELANLFCMQTDAVRKRIDYRQLTPDLQIGRKSFYLFSRALEMMSTFPRNQYPITSIAPTMNK